MKKLLAIAIALGSVMNAQADDLSKVSPEKALNFHNMRLNKITTIYDRETIAPASKVRELKRDTKPNKTIDKELAKTDLLSLMIWDGEKVIVDSLSDKKLKPTDKMYSFSMAKSFTSYLIGEASCDGYIDLNSPMVTYIPETAGTLYETVTVHQMLDMAAGDAVIYGKTRSPDEYNPLLMKLNPAERETVIGAMKSKSTGVTTDLTGTFRYSDSVTDLLAHALDKATPAGLGAFFHDKLAEPSGTADEMFYLKDADGSPILHAYLHATRDDYLRMAITISDSWRSDSCVGNYLRSQYEERIPTKNDLGKSYGGQFWFDSKYGTPSMAVMNGFGGQHIYLDMNSGNIITMHAIRTNYDEGKVVKAALKELK